MIRVKLALLLVLTVGVLSVNVDSAPVQLYRAPIQFEPVSQMQSGIPEYQVTIYLRSEFSSSDIRENLMHNRDENSLTVQEIDEMTAEIRRQAKDYYSNLNAAFVKDYNLENVSYSNYSSFITYRLPYSKRLRHDIETRNIRKIDSKLLILQTDPRVQCITIQEKYTPVNYGA